VIAHGDYYAENLIFDRDKLVGVVDYDQAHRCARITELAEALIYFARERQGRFQHIVYSDVLDFGSTEAFLNAYSPFIHLTGQEAEAFPHLLRTVWLCASLAPPLEPEMDADLALQTLPEVLALARWARIQAPALSSLVRDAQKGQPDWELYHPQNTKLL
jgi:Ser/Thr protein kinase RdoA (MazF antagonist)